MSFLLVQNDKNLRTFGQRIHLHPLYNLWCPWKQIFCRVLMVAIYKFFFCKVAENFIWSVFRMPVVFISSWLTLFSISDIIAISHAKYNCLVTRMISNIRVWFWRLLSTILARFSYLFSQLCHRSLLVRNFLAEVFKSLLVIRSWIFIFLLNLSLSFHTRNQENSSIKQSLFCSSLFQIACKPKIYYF